ncbi:MAG: hypothetical protein HOC23_13750 [Halieaceae bacterium]|jgi:hypothetical protein|nr:hypothetical protein [Halieaceae bacterium]
MTHSSPLHLTPAKQRVALKRYLERHIEEDLPDAPPGTGRWNHVLVIPAYDEQPGMLQQFLKPAVDSGRKLVIVVLNRPQSNARPDANEAMRSAARALAIADPGVANATPIYRLNNSTDLLLYDLELKSGPSPSDQGVGLARKTGCDIALLWISQGSIASDWICCSDADATLPPDYFQRLEYMADDTTATTYPFHHETGTDDACSNATAWYELRLHYYVLGLKHAGSPYAHHALGSTLAVRADSYAKVRGFPKRAGGEDFYLLNKLAKMGPVAGLDGRCITLHSRPSHRVPFGTGPAVDRISRVENREKLALFEHPLCFEALRAVLTIVPQLYYQAPDEIPDLLAGQSLPADLAGATSNTLTTMGIEDALNHCRRQGRTEAQFRRQFDQWFDGFRSLKFIHAIRDAGWPNQCFTDLLEVDPAWWPANLAEMGDIEMLRRKIRQQFGWTIEETGL